jgi:branched-chain amino acid transport system substrate-binding protein
MKKVALDVPPLQTDPANPTRRRFLWTTAAASVAAATAPVVLLSRPASASARTLKIGFINPRTGVLAPFGEGEGFVLADVRKHVAKGILVNGTHHPVEILDRDSASDPVRAAELASALVESDKVDLMLAASTGDTVTPVSNLWRRMASPASPPILLGRSTSWDETATSTRASIGPTISSGAWRT